MVFYPLRGLKQSFTPLGLDTVSQYAVDVCNLEMGLFISTSTDANLVTDGKRN